MCAATVAATVRAQQAALHLPSRRGDVARGSREVLRSHEPQMQVYSSIYVCICVCMQVTSAVIEMFLTLSRLTTLGMRKITIEEAE